MTPAPLLSLRGLRKTFPILGGPWQRQRGSVVALDGVSLDVEPGDTLAIVGGSGCGKSTLAKIISGLLPADSGAVLWEGEPMDTLSRQERAGRIQMIFQDPYASLNPKLTVGTQLLECVPEGESADGRAGELLESVGLSGDALAHYPFQFSGGQRQRIAIARALALRPRLLIADEPLSALDVTIQAQILDLLKQLQVSQGLTMLFITHDLALARNASDRVVVLQEGRVVEEGVSRHVLQAPRHPYTQALLDAVPVLP